MAPEQLIRVEVVDIDVGRVFHGAGRHIAFHQVAGDIALARPRALALKVAADALDGTGHERYAPFGENKF
jgi:hypothetical protein